MEEHEDYFINGSTEMKPGENRCGYDPNTIDKVIEVTAKNGEQIGLLTEEIKVMSLNYRDMNRWMLWALLVIALGNAGVELFSKLGK